MSFPATTPRQSAFLGHILVAVGACFLTVAIFGSAIFLIYRIYHKYQLRAQVREVVASLENRTPEELAETATEVRRRPKMARLILPEVLHSLRNSRSERQQYSTIQVLRFFVADEEVEVEIEKTLFRLRRDSRATVAAAAVEALGDLQPPEHAAAILGKVLADAQAESVTPAAVDEACAALIRLGEVGRLAIEPHLPGLSVDRRVWLVRYIDRNGGKQRTAWLELLLRDAEARVRAAAETALRPQSGSQKTTAAPDQA